MSSNEVSIICRYGGDFVEESNDEVSYKDGTNRIIRLEAQEINYRSLLSKVLEVCRWTQTQIGSIKYKHPKFSLNCLVSIENDEDIINMMKEFSQNNGPIQLYVFETQKILSIDKAIIPSTGKEIAKDQHGSKEMSLPRMPTDVLQLGMDHEIRMDNQNLPTKNSAEFGCANDNMVLLLPPSMELEEGQEFPDANAFHKFLREYAIRLNFEYKRTRSGHGCFAAKCIKEDCPWLIQALRLSHQSTFKIKSLKGKHTCNLNKHLKRTSHYQATRKWIADIVEHRNYYQYTPKVIADVIEKEYGIEVGYHKAWRGRELARERRSSIKKSGQGYASKYNIEKLCEDTSKTIPGSWVKLQSKSKDNNDLKLFISYERAKVYLLNDEGKWDDRGTGWVNVDYLERSEDPVLFVVDEEDNDTLLVHDISSDDIYHREIDTFICWQDPDFSTELALSFQESVGCSYIWDHICAAQRNLQFDTLSNLENGSHPTSENIKTSRTSHANGNGGWELGQW